jgi:hypothetical protein
MSTINKIMSGMATLGNLSIIYIFNKGTIKMYV